MFPDSLNILGVFSLVFLAVVCIKLTFIAWFDGTQGDFSAMKSHLRIIGVAQIAIVVTAISIGMDMVAARKFDGPSVNISDVQERNVVAQASIRH